jgi:hypothetical protein
MLAWGPRRDAKEIAGQILRIVGAATKTALGLVPIGNTGGANVSPLKPMAVAGDLAEILAATTGCSTGKLLLPGQETGRERPRWAAPSSGDAVAPRGPVCSTVRDPLAGSRRVPADR